ncbi:MAG: hypothetical protein QE271_03965 [Bacteriovoracaceae bacterium]|nr:hypothetical protein [Bacteriovoracaceae bacterium]
MKYLFIILGATILFNYPLKSFGKDSVSKMDTNDADQVEVQDLPEAHHKKNYDLTSKESREEKKYEGMLGAGYESTALAGSVAVGAFLNPSNILQLKYATGTKSSTTTATYSDGTTRTYNTEGEEKITHLSLSLKTFLGNSFYIKPSIGYMEYSNRRTLDVIVDSFFGQDTPLEQLSGYTVGAAIGNQWINKQFTFGCEWLGINRVVYATKKENDPDRQRPLVTYVYLGFVF